MIMSNNVDLLSPPLTHGSPLSPSVCTCYRYCEWCSTVSFASLRCFVPYRYALKIKWHSKRHCNWNKLAAPLTLRFTCAVIYICRKKCMNLFALFVFHQKKKRKKEIESGQQRLDHNPHVPSTFSPHCISDTGRHFSALHTYKCTYIWHMCFVWICIVVCVVWQAGAAACIYFWLAAVCVSLSVQHMQRPCVCRAWFIVQSFICLHTHTHTHTPHVRRL